MMCHLHIQCKFSNLQLIWCSKHFKYSVELMRHVVLTDAENRSESDDDILHVGVSKGYQTNSCACQIIVCALLLRMQLAIVCFLGQHTSGYSRKLSPSSFPTLLLEAT